MVVVSSTCDKSESHTIYWRRRALRETCPPMYTVRFSVSPSLLGGRFRTCEEQGLAAGGAADTETGPKKKSALRVVPPKQCVRAVCDRRGLYVPTGGAGASPAALLDWSRARTPLAAERTDALLLLPRTRTAANAPKRRRRRRGESRGRGEARVAASGGSTGASPMSTRMGKGQRARSALVAGGNPTVKRLAVLFAADSLFLRALFSGGGAHRHARSVTSSRTWRVRVKARRNARTLANAVPFFVRRGAHFDGSRFCAWCRK